MSDNINKDDILKAVDKVEHPEIKNTLIELGMIGDIQIIDDKVIVKLAIPQMNIPEEIKNILKEIVKKPIMQLGIACEVEFTEMSKENKARFFAMAMANWRG
jgi:metal-sulfur cluster biosynthetic enzyme